MDVALHREKIEQAQALLNELDLDVWMLFVRETSMHGDPAMPLIAPFDLTWESALLIDRNGTRIAIVGRYDMQPVEATELWSIVRGYDASIADVLRDTLQSLDPHTIALNYSTDEVAADGLSHGMYLRLHELLQNTAYPDRFVSAHELASRLRAQKTLREQALLVAATEAAEEIFDVVKRSIATGMSERGIADLMHRETAARGLGTAWPSAACPIVNTGPASPIGHATPTHLAIQPGHLVHIDFGVQRDGYCSDQQRMWYVLRAGETAPPDEVRRAWDVVRGAIDRAFAAIKPGMQGWQIDAIARTAFEEAGVPAYGHALGHGIGRAVHDGGPLLGPCWDRYGQTPYGTILPGMVFTLECGMDTPHGYLGLEDEIVIEDDGARWLAPPQTELWLI